MTGRTFTDEQLFRAFRYASGEFSSEEIQEFEGSLAEDLSLCDALVEATRLSLSLVAVEPPAVSVRIVGNAKSSADRRQSSARLASAVAVLSCVAVLWFVSGRHDVRPTKVVTPYSDAELILSVWADESDTEILSDAEDARTEDDDLEVPDWLLTAVSLTDVDGTDFDDMRDMEL